VIKMLSIILKNIAYSYYPKGICNISNKEKYLNSLEYKKTEQLLSSFFDTEESKMTYDALLYELQRLTFVKEIKDATLLQWQDRCLSFEIEYLEGDKLTRICIHISLLIPYYLIYILDNAVAFEPYRWLSYPQRNIEKEKHEFAERISEISKVIESVTNFHPFNEELAEIVLPDLNFKDIRMGEFTLFNAFFLDDNNYILDIEQ